MPSIEPQAIPITDIAIIGGGVSGAYTAYRLMKANPDESPVLKSLLELSGKEKLDVNLFELSDRIGGRLWSINMPGLPNIPAEMGGMRFLESQQNVYGLCTKELKLDVSSLNFADNIQYLRRQRFSFNEYSNPEKVPYFMVGKEKGKTPIELVEMAIYEIEPKAKDFYNTSLAMCLRNTWAKDAPLYNKPLYKTGFWNLLASKLSIEAYDLVIDASGYFSIYGSWNSYAAFLEFLRNYADNNYLKLDRGFQQLPETLALEFLKMGGEVLTNKKLYKLQVEEYNGEQLIAMTIGTPKSPIRTVQYARYVVLAMPQRSLELLDPDSFIFLNRQFKKDLATVTAQASSKLFLSYDRPWWQELSPKIAMGRSDTDLPLRQCYYVGTETQEPNQGMSLMMASYNDGRSTSFWSAYLQLDRFGQHNPPYMGRHGGQLKQSLVAPHDMVMEIQRQLKEMHNFDIPNPLGAIYYDWMEDPFGGAWYFWNPHVRSWEVAPRIRQPMPGYNVFLCGDCYSENQGWVEGALNTAEMVLETEFGLPRPNWVEDENYYFGP